MFQLIVSNVLGSIVRALRSAGRALKRLAKRTVDPITGAVRWAYDRSLDVSHDAIDLAEHAAQIPGAALGAVLGNRPPEPGDIAAMAMASADQRPRPAPVASAPAALAQRDIDPTMAVIAAAKDRRGLEIFHDIPQTHCSWLAYMTDEERAVIANATPHQIRGHLTGVALLPGIPPVWTQARLDEANAREAMIMKHLEEGPVYAQAARDLEQRHRHDEPPDLHTAAVIRPARFNRRRPEAEEAEPEVAALRM